jgi:hypothetical protein
MRYRPGMSARTPRRSFAAPFVITLAAAPACYVNSAPAPQPQPQPQPAEQTPPQNAPGTIVMNPPRPEPAQTQPDPTQSHPPTPIMNPPRPQPQDPAAPQPVPAPTNPSVVMNPPRPEPAGTRWHVFKAEDSCKAVLDVRCPEGATCNPPPPTKIACPDGLTMPRGLNIVSQGNGTCIVEPEPVSCPPHAMCNPPRPRSVSCPK